MGTTPVVLNTGILIQYMNKQKTHYTMRKARGKKITRKYIK
jgi:hypothetical protein